MQSFSNELSISVSDNTNKWNLYDIYFLRREILLRIEVPWLEKHQRPKYETAFSTVLGLISSVYRDLHQ